jgi:HTH-type transcriptional regulator / antitoxin HigA
LEIRPIRTEEDYRVVLAVVLAPMNAEARTLGGDHLDILATLIEAYEAIHYPVAASDPKPMVPASNSMP